MDKAPDLNPGDEVLYSPSRNGPQFSGVVDSEPWLLGGHTWCVHLSQMEDAYGVHTGRPGRTTVKAAACDHIVLNKDIRP